LIVSVVIPSYKRLEPLCRCIESVQKASTLVHGTVEIIVSASGYTDTELDLIRLTGVRLAVSKRRMLVSVARNHGARGALGQFLLFVDDDNVLDNQCVERLREALVEAPHIAVAGPLTYYGDDPTRVWCAGVTRSPVLGRTRLVTKLPRPLPELMPSDDYPNCFIVRLADFEAVGGFDCRLFPHHYEEADLAARMKRRGLGGAVCVTSARAWHFITGGLTSRLHLEDDERAYYNGRARAVYTAKYGNRMAWIAYLVIGQLLFTGFYLGPGLSDIPWRRRLPIARSFLRGVVDGIQIGFNYRKGQHGRRSARSSRQHGL